MISIDEAMEVKHSPARVAVSVESAFKKYSNKKESNNILNGFNMTVREGNIYSLLGSSGCGKTTLLSCVVGMRKLDAGNISVFGCKPGSKGSGVPGRRVGFMPQEIALYPEFTIGEILNYYGRLYGMPKWEVEDNTKFLISFLNLPSSTRRIMALSGGQQRRVSFAVALIHNPELLILDEPTVGVDPLLRKSIWSHLVKLASTTKTTIIITTHFIEEARDSHCIGLMRNGRLLEEDSPTALMLRYNTFILEEIVVQLCLRDTHGSPDEVTVDVERKNIDEPNINRFVEDFKSKGSGSYQSTREPTPAVEGPDLNSVPDSDPEKSESNRRASLGQMLHRASTTIAAGKGNTKLEFVEKGERIYALLIKNVLVMIRNLIFVVFIIGLPALQVVLVCLAIGIDPHAIKIGIVNNEMLIQDLDCEDFIHNKTGCLMGSASKYGTFASCQFINTLDPYVFTLINYESEEEAIEDVRETKLWGLMVFPANFTNHLRDRLTFGVYAEAESLNKSRIRFNLDMSNKQVGLQIQKNFYSTLKDWMYASARACKVDTAGLDTPLHFDTPVFGNDSTNFTEFIAPGVLLAVLFFFPLCSTGVLMITEKKSGALERTMVAGVTYLDLMLSHLGTQFFLLISQTILSYLIMISVFKIEVHGSILLAMSLGVSIGISGISFGFFMGTVCKDELEAVMLSLGTFMPNFVLSGVMWPLEGMPIYLQRLAYILPCTLAGESLRSIIGRGVAFTHRSVWPGFLSTAAYITLYWVLTLTITRIKKVN